MVAASRFLREPELTDRCDGARALEETRRLSQEAGIAVEGPSRHNYPLTCHRKVWPSLRHEVLPPASGSTSLTYLIADLPLHLPNLLLNRWIFL